MTYMRLSDEHVQQVRAAAEERFSTDQAKFSNGLNHEEVYVQGFTDGYLKCFSVYDCAHKKSGHILNNLTGNPDDPKKQPHTLNDGYLEFIVGTARHNARRIDTARLAAVDCYVNGFLEGYTTCWNMYQLHDLEDQMGEIIAPTPEEVELIQKLLSGWNLGHVNQEIRKQ